MKKTSLLNSRISAVIAEMGHTDTICIGDAGLPAPKGVERIDLAVTNGIPAILDVLDAVSGELQVEGITLASEMREANGTLYEAITKRFPDIAIQEVPHEAFKKMTTDCKAFVRTGECVPYANLILHAGVTF